MAKWSSAAFLDGGLNYLKATATHLTVIKAYTVGDSFATVNGNVVADAVMTSADYTISSTGSNRQIVSAAKSATASTNSGTSPNLHFAFHDGANVIWVTDETSDQVITAGNTVNIPQLTYTTNQPT